MKTIIKTSFAILLFTVVMSCNKENIKSSAPQSINQSATSTSTDAVQAIHHIGDMFGGGIIFYLDSTKMHGLIVTQSDLSVNQNAQIQWYNGTYKVTNARGVDIGTGAQNTTMIVNAQGSGTYAAKLCADLVLNGFSDWYLPSKAELNALYNHRSKVPGLDATNYWSSTEFGRMKAWDQEFGGGFKFSDQKSFTLRVRAVRSF